MLKALSISRKLGVSFATILLAAALTMGFVYYESMQVSRMSEVNERSDTEQALAAEIETALLAAVAAVRGQRVSDTPSDMAAFTRNVARFDAAVDRLRPMLETPRERAELEDTLTRFRNWRTGTVDPVFAGMSAADRERARTLSESASAGEDLLRLQQGAEQLRVSKHESVERNLKAVEEAAREQETAVLVGGAVLTLVSLLLWAALRGLLARPIIAITALMKRLAAGENRIEVPDADRGDEIGDMARAVIVFRDTAIAKEAADAAKARADAEQAEVVDTLALRLGALAEGDMTAHIGPEFPSGYARIRQNFNDAVGALRKLIGAVRESAETIRSGSAEIATASETLAQRTQSNAASLEETTAAISQIDQRLRATAEAARSTSGSADEAIVAVRSGRAITDEAVQAMGRVAESAKAIDGVIEGLDKIAFQTRVLAMNAAVEAGRAGDAGRGFAVVADLVSALAMRAEEEAKRARDQLTATQADITVAVSSVQRVDGALAEIRSGVDQVHHLIGGIAGENGAQALAVGQVSDAINVMDRATQQNAAMVEETSAAARTLNAEVETLAAQAGRFRLESHGHAAPPRIASATLH